MSGEAEDMGRKDGEGWLDRMEKERPVAEKQLDPGDAFQPHHGDETDLNQLGADLLADPDPSFDPFQQKGAPGGTGADTGAAKRVTVSGSDLEVLSKPKRDAPPDATSTEGKRLAAVVAHTYAAAAPGRAQYRGSVAHAVDATYGDVDPHAVVKTTQALIDHVYSADGDVTAAGDAEVIEEPVVDGGGEDSARP